MPEPYLPLHIDSTMMSCFRNCPRRFYYEFILGLRPTSLSVDLHAGGCFATALERYYKAVYTEQVTNDKALQRSLGAFLAAWGDFEPIKDTPKTKERMWEAVEDYFRKWSPQTDEVQPYRGTDGEPTYEFTFGIPLASAIEPDGDYEKLSTHSAFPLHPSGQPFIYAGKFDMLGQKHGRVRWRDEKTTKYIGKDWAEQWDLRSQFIGYTWACQQSGLDCDGGVVRGIGITKTKPANLVEAEKIYSNMLIARWYEQLRRDLWRLRKMWDEQYWDFNLGDACTSYGGCAFRLPCSSDSPERWYSGYTVRRWNPLLKNPISEEPVAA